jgi:hypothetical protein
MSLIYTALQQSEICPENNNPYAAAAAIINGDLNFTEIVNQLSTHFQQYGVQFIADDGTTNTIDNMNDFNDFCDHPNHLPASIQEAIFDHMGLSNNLLGAYTQNSTIEATIEAAIQALIVQTHIENRSTCPITLEEISSNNATNFVLVQPRNGEGPTFVCDYGSLRNWLAYNRNFPPTRVPIEQYTVYQIVDQDEVLQPGNVLEPITRYTPPLIPEDPNNNTASTTTTRATAPSSDTTTTTTTAPSSAPSSYPSAAATNPSDTRCSIL